MILKIFATCIIESMETHVSQLTVKELRAIIADVVDEKLRDLIDGESGLEIADEIQSRLLKQERDVANGDRGISMETALKDLNLA